MKNYCLQIVPARGVNALENVPFREYRLKIRTVEAPVAVVCKAVCPGGFSPKAIESQPPVSELMFV
jgi:hypothetical protein